MSETKDDIAAERDALREENRRLSAQLVAAGRPAAGAYRPAAEFQLSEGDRQELQIYGVANIGGRLRTIDEVRGMLGEKQQGVELTDPPAATDRRLELHQTEVERAGIRGFDYVYPSVAPGQIDPAVAGTPGISGPSADDVTTEVDYDPAVHGE
jgi:hypothetical protein